MEILGVGKVLGFNVQKNLSKHSMEFIGKTVFNKKKNNRKINTI